MLVALALALFPAEDPAYSTFNRAYAALRSKAYDEAVALFRSGLLVSPHRADIRKDLAYTLLKTGETVAARDHFAEAARLVPTDHNAALEYAFLAFETGLHREARLVFDRVRATGDKASRLTAEQAFQNVDRPLAEGIARWQEALRRDPENYSAHYELGSLAERRNDWALAARHYEHAWRIKKTERKLLLDLGRAHKELGHVEQSVAALLAASRGAEARSAEAARALLPDRYPYPYEFRLAIDLDPSNTELKRELAYLLLEMDQRVEAESEFERITTTEPDDLLSHAQLGFLRLARRDRAGAMPLLQRVLDADADDELSERVRIALELPRRLRRRPEQPRRDLVEEARTLAFRSYDAGYLKDALKYLTIAHEHDPLDAPVALKLGYTNNLLGDDRAAAGWFALARKSNDRAVSREASKALRNVRSGLPHLSASFWAFPMYSSRWGDAFAYAQGRVEANLPVLPLRPYMSIRFIGDLRGTVHGPSPQYLSETAVIPALGIATRTHHGAFAWAEAGVAFSYLRRTDQTSRARSDFRAGVSYQHTLGGRTFLQHEDDALYVSRFGNTMLLYTRNRLGRALTDSVRVYWNMNLTADTQRQYWANFVEAGPGVRWRSFSLDLVRGRNLVNEGNPRPAAFTDLRAGMWYALRR